MSSPTGKKWQSPAVAELATLRTELEIIAAGNAFDAASANLRKALNDILSPPHKIGRDGIGPFANETLRRAYKLAVFAFPVLRIEYVRFCNEAGKLGAVYLEGGNPQGFRPYMSRRDCALVYPQIIARGRWEQFSCFHTRHEPPGKIGTQYTREQRLLMAPPDQLFAALLFAAEIE